MHGGLRWGLRPFGDKMSTVNLYVGIESLRNTWAPLHSRLSVWLLEVVDFSGVPDDAAPPTPEFWQVLGVDEKWQERLCEVSPCFYNGKLYMSPALEADPEGWNKLGDVWAFFDELEKVQHQSMARPRREQPLVAPFHELRRGRLGSVCAGGPLGRGVPHSRSGPSRRA